LAGETNSISSSTRLEKCAGNEFKIYGLSCSGSENEECKGYKEYHLRAASATARDEWTDHISRVIFGARKLPRDSESTEAAAGRYVVRFDA
jgi:hypothetical protein